MVALSGRLRLSPQSRLDQRSAAREQVPPRSRPWLDKDEDEVTGPWNIRRRNGNSGDTDEAGE
jgi:hypothetical protein